MNEGPAIPPESMLILLGIVIYLNNIWFSAEAAYQMRRKPWQWALFAVFAPLVAPGLLWYQAVIHQERVRITTQSIVIFNVLIAISFTSPMFTDRKPA